MTGTDTDVGKTAVTASLARAARRYGTVCAAKPIASGVSPGTAGEDAERIAAAAGHAPRVFAAFRAPVSPHRAALAEGRSVDPEALGRWIADLRADTVLVEGAGGWRVPIAGDLWTVDLARATGGPVVIVAPDRLGVLNHALLTAEAIRADGLVVAAVVLNRWFQADASRPTNLDDLTALVGAPVFPFPAIDLSDAAAAGEAGAAILHGIVAGERR